jgi:hypothetical protein
MVVFCLGEEALDLALLVVRVLGRRGHGAERALDGLKDTVVEEGAGDGRGGEEEADAAAGAGVHDAFARVQRRRER